MRSVRIVVRGRVQGVGFRWFTQDAAEKFDVTGWVRNVRDGSVEAELHGSDVDVQAVLDSLASGPAVAHVDEVSVADHPRSESDAFEILPTAPAREN